MNQTEELLYSDRLNSYENELLSTMKTKMKEFIKAHSNK